MSNLSAEAPAGDVAAPAQPRPALPLDLYELTMGESYLAEGMAERPATFQLLCRRLPRGSGYLVAAGLDAALAHLETIRFVDDDLAYLEGLGLFSARYLDRLAELRFNGSVRAMFEGTPFFAHEPVLEVTAPLLEAQLVETMVLNEMHFQSLIAAKAARCVDASRGRSLVDFSLRSTHGGEAGLKVARATYLAGFDATSNVQAGRLFGIPVAGTMAHSFVESFEDEADAFAAFARAYPRRSTLLIDTYDTVEGAKRVARLAKELAGDFRLGGVRHSGDLLDLSRRVRRVLDEAGLRDVTIFASGSLDEWKVARLLDRAAPIDGFGIGSRLGVSADAPYLDMAYKLVAFDGRPTLKLSDGKATLPGPKQVWRLRGGSRVTGDTIALLDEADPPDAESQLQPVMVNGRRVEHETLEAARARAAEHRARLPEECRRLDAQPYPVRCSESLVALRYALTHRIRGD